MKRNNNGERGLRWHKDDTLLKQDVFYSYNTKTVICMHNMHDMHIMHDTHDMHDMLDTHNMHA